MRGIRSAWRGLICAAILVACGRTQASTDTPPTASPISLGPPQVRATAVVISRKGKVELQHGIAGDWSDAQVGDRLAPSDALRTQAGEAELGVDGVKMRVHEASALRVQETSERSMRAKVSGSIESEVEPGKGILDVEVDGSDARAHSQGGHFFVTADGRGVVAVAAVTGSVNLTALLAFAVTLAAEPRALTLGRDATAKVEIRVTGAFGRRLPGARVTLSTNLGSVSAPEAAGDGTFTASFTPPRSRTPSVAILSADAELEGEHDIGWLALPLSGSDSMTVETRPHSAVVLRILDRTFGPVIADDRGLARIEVVVPPGVAKATMHVEDKLGNTTDRTLNLDPPPFVQMRAVAVGPPQASWDEPLEIEVFTVRRDGTPDPNAEVTGS